MKKMLLIVLCCIVVLNVGCIFDDDNDDDSPAGEYLDSYFPLNPDLIRIYKVTRTFNGVALVDTLTRVFSVKTALQGNVYYTMRYTGSSDLSYYRIENDILYRYYPENNKVYVPYSHEEPILDFTKKPGESWEIVANSLVEDKQTTKYSLTSIFIGTETIQVPVRTFQDCARYDNLEKVVFTDFSGEEPKESETIMNYSAWYSKGMGLVKATAEGELFGDYTIELISFFLPD